MCYSPSRKLFRPLVFCLLVLLTAILRTPAQNLERTNNVAIIHSDTGLVRIEACSDSVIHVVAGPAASHPTKPIVPTVIQPCLNTKFTIGADGYRIRVQTTKIKVEVDKHTGAIQFLTAGRELILSEQARNGRIVPPAEASDSNASDSNDGVRQEFLLSPGEALYGLGQHQEGFFNLRDIPVE